MDSRQEPRFETDQEVTVTLLGDVEIGFAGRIVNVSGKGMCLDIPQAVPAGGAIKLEVEDTLVLGEVIYCRPFAGRYQIGVALQEALYHTKALAALLERLLGRDPVRQIV
jgi:hypothetical protein